MDDAAWYSVGAFSVPTQGILQEPTERFASELHFAGPAVHGLRHTDGLKLLFVVWLHNHGRAAFVKQKSDEVWLTDASDGITEYMNLAFLQIEGDVGVIAQIHSPFSSPATLREP